MLTAMFVAIPSGSAFISSDISIPYALIFLSTYSRVNCFSSISYTSFESLQEYAEAIDEIASQLLFLNLLIFLNLS